MPESTSSIPTEEIFKAAEKLPPFPGVIWKVMSLLRKQAPVKEIEEVIKVDQAIAAKVLAMSRSAFYARKYPTASLKGAIVALGEQELTRIVMAACAARYFETGLSGYESREGELWRHAVATAMISETVAKSFDKERALTVYTAALLHDIGKAVLSLYVKTYMDAIVILMSRKGFGMLEAERKTFGVDHEQLGEMIAKRWRFPEEVVVGIGFHHRPKEATSHEDIAAAVYVANRAATALGYGCGRERLVESYDHEIYGTLGITSDSVNQFCTEIADTTGEIKDLLPDNSSASRKDADT
ncbi:MAG: HDOD domain-containing protein [Thermodesulfobacteriota bacterium]|nr:HDOD domain-containing protein [Thermodesulfobacteriota bacterium]